MIGSKFLLTYELVQIIKNIFFYESPHKPSSEKPFSSPNSEKLDEKLTLEKLSELQRLQSTPHKTPLKTIKFVINADNPQINVNYQLKDSQMLLSSKKDCLIIFYEKNLIFDKFKIDTKKFIHFYFSQMEGFTAPTNIDINNQIFWLPTLFYQPNRIHSKSFEEYELREGMLNRIFMCNYLSITINFFQLPECELDFSDKNLVKSGKGDKRFYWDQEPRMRNVMINVGKLLSFMDSKSYFNFRNVMDLLAMMVSSDEKIKEIEKENKELLKELKKFSKQTVLNNINEKIAEIAFNNARYRSNFEYSIDFGEFSMIKGEKPFLKFSIEKFKGSHLFFEDESSFYQLIIKKIDLKNLLEPNEKEYSSIMTIFEEKNNEKIADIEETPMITLKMHYNLVNGLVLMNKWKVLEQYEVKIVPLVIRMTEEIYNYYYEYVFSSQNEQNFYEKTDRNENYIREKQIDIKKKVQLYEKFINYFNK